MRRGCRESRVRDLPLALLGLAPVTSSQGTYNETDLGRCVQMQLRGVSIDVTLSREAVWSVLKRKWSRPSWYPCPNIQRPSREKRGGACGLECGSWKARGNERSRRQCLGDTECEEGQGLASQVWEMTLIREHAMRGIQPWA